jgi:hypothetical protein
VFSVLVVVFSFNGVARGGCGLRQRKISITAPLPIAEVLLTISGWSEADGSLMLRSAD